MIYIRRVVIRSRAKKPKANRPKSELFASHSDFIADSADFIALKWVIIDVVDISSCFICKYSFRLSRTAVHVRYFHYCAHVRANFNGNWRLRSDSLFPMLGFCPASHVSGGVFAVPPPSCPSRRARKIAS